MPVPLSRRLLCCAAMVPQGARVADVGADHGYLCLWLLEQGVARDAAACDLRPGPLDSARRNAALYGMEDRMAFFLSDGLQSVPQERYDTVVCAGMGGELIVKILSEAPWLRDPRYTLILQPQIDVDLLRLWLSENGFAEDRAELVSDGGFLYCALRARYTGEPYSLTPGQRYVSPALQASGSPLLPEYIARTKATLCRIAAGLSKADANPEPARLDTLQAAIRELEEMERDYVNR